MNITKKFVLVGKFGVGKTSLIRRFVDNDFDTNYQVTIGVQVKKKEVVIDNDKVSLLIWDIEGNTSIDKARKTYLLGSSGFIYVFDLNRPETFEDISSEMIYLENNYPNTPILLIGNKEDLVDTEEKKSYFLNNNIEVDFFSSAKSGKGVNEMFQDLSKKLLLNES
jgi:small GTP-binding protein